MDKVHKRWRRSQPKLSSAAKIRQERAQKAIAARKRQSATNESLSPGTSKRRRLDTTTKAHQAETSAGASQDGDQAEPGSCRTTEPTSTERRRLSASRRKIQLFEEILPLSALEGSGEEAAVGKFLLVSVKNLTSVVQCLPCATCNQKSLSVQLHDPKGFAFKIKVTCTLCEEVFCDEWCSDRVTKSNTSRPPFEINRAMTESFLSIGLGHAGIMTFSKTMGMTTMSRPTFDEHVRALHTDLQDFKIQVLKEAREMVREALEVEDPALKTQEIINISISYDGTWQKRGFTSFYGIGFAIELSTGLVIDYELLSKYCSACIMAEKSKGKDSEEFEFWFTNHKQSGMCNMNYEGSSPAMEAEAACRIFRRSESYGFRFVNILADGDSKTFARLNEEQPYGPDVVIKKEECINHVSKRLFKNLESLKKSCRAKGVTLGGQGEGQLTKHIMSKLSSYYRKAIEENKDSVPDMRKAILATPHHCASSDANPNHSYCPSGKNSWCFWQSAKAQKKNPGKHNEMLGTKINSTVFSHIMPIYERLAQNELLERCRRGGTQNTNECLHSMVWHRTPKEIFVSTSRLEIAIVHAVAEFNMGQKVATFLEYKTRGQSVPGVIEASASKIDEKRMKRSDKGLSRHERAARRKAKTEKESAQKKKEGTTYKPGGF